VTEEVTGEMNSAPGGGDDVEVEAPFYHEGAPQAFQRLWTPHRMVYIGGQNKPSDDTPAQCPFCTGPQRGDEESLIVHRGQTSYVIMNLYPYNTGHLLVCPYRHISDWTEATPAEGTTYRFAKEDRKRYPGILQAGTETNPYYTNSSQIPVGYTDDPFEAQEMQEELQTKYTGGTVLHLYMNERISSAAACKELVCRSLTAFRTPYITITPTFSICPVHGYLVGEHLTCDKCAELHPAAEPVECEVWTRVMGYFRPVESFNIGKKGEFHERQYFSETYV